MNRRPNIWLPQGVTLFKILFSIGQEAVKFKYLSGVGSPKIMKIVGIQIKALIATGNKIIYTIMKFSTSRYWIIYKEAAFSGIPEMDESWKAYKKAPAWEPSWQQETQEAPK